MKLKKMKQLVRESMLSEIGDLSNIKTYNYSKIDNYKYFFETKLGDVNVDFFVFDPKDYKSFKVRYRDYDYTNAIYNVVYDIEGVTSQVSKTNYSTLIRIIGTVAKIVQEFINKNSPYSVMLFGEDKKGRGMSDRQKNSLYLMVANNNLPSGYRISDAEVVDLQMKLEGKIIFKN